MSILTLIVIVAVIAIIAGMLLDKIAWERGAILLLVIAVVIVLWRYLSSGPSL